MATSALDSRRRHTLSVNDFLAFNTVASERQCLQASQRNFLSTSLASTECPGVDLFDGVLDIALALSELTSNRQQALLLAKSIGVITWVIVGSFSEFGRLAEVSNLIVELFEFCLSVLEFIAKLSLDSFEIFIASRHRCGPLHV
jgi:hypothetical protein